MSDEPTNGDDGADFFDGDPVRKKVFEEYDPDADPAEVLEESDLSYQGELEVLKEKEQSPSEENPKRYGLPSFEMDDPPDHVDDEEWEEAKRLPDEKQHNLWRAWRFGTDQVDQGDPEVRGKIYGEMRGMMWEAIHDIDDAAAPEPAMIDEGRKLVFQGIDGFDPRKGDGKLSSHVYNQIWGGGNANKIKEAVRKHGDSKKQRYETVKHIDEFNDFMQKFEEQRGREATAADAAEHITELDLEDAKKIKFEDADEYSTANTIDEETLSGDLSLDEKDAVQTVYVDATGREQLVMEYYFPDLLGGTKPPSGVNKGLHEYVAGKAGVHPSTISRDVKKIKKRIKKQA